MPVPMNAATSPLQVISNIFEARHGDENWETQIEQHFQSEFDKPEFLSNVTCLNLVENHALSDGQLVRFRCMVQDMFDPEYYMSQYQVKNLKDGSVKMKCGRYRDVVQCGLGEEVMDVGDSVLRERQCLYCVSPPGESGWVTDGFRRLVSPEVAPGPSGTQSLTMKRSHDNDNNLIENNDNAMEMDTVTVTGGTENNKKQKSNEKVEVPTIPANESVSKNNVDIKNKLNLPLPSANGKACIVKLYNLRDGDIKLHDLVEFIGVISLDPAIAANDNDDDEMMSSTPSLPPPSLVPRLHVLSFKQLKHNNPLVPQLTMSPIQEVARVELHTLLTTCLLGDRLAADYLLLHLISRVYMRKDVLVLGKLSLNLHNMTSHEDWPRRVSTILSMLTTNSHHLSLSRKTLDNTHFAPRKDYEANRLVTGSLQLPAGTHLWLDETAMTDGQLSATGVKNLTSLGNLITWQKLEYDFEFQKMEYDTDVACLVMSEGRSMLPSDVQIMLKPDGVEVRPDLISKTFSEIGAALTPELLERIRKYITTCRFGTFNLTEQVMKAVQDDFVSMRQTDNGVTVEDFHSLLVLGRLVSLSYGRDTLTPQDWEDAKRMEKDRKERVASLPARPGAHMANGMNVNLHPQGDQ